MTERFRPTESLLSSQLEAARAQNEALRQSNLDLRNNLRNEKVRGAATHVPKEFRGAEDASIKSDLSESSRESERQDRAARRLAEDPNARVDSSVRGEIRQPGNRKDVDFASTKVEKDGRITKTDLGYNLLKSDKQGKPELWTFDLDKKLVSHEFVKADGSVVTDSYEPAKQGDWTKPVKRDSTTPTSIDLKTAIQGQVLRSEQVVHKDRSFKLTTFESDGKGGVMLAGVHENTLKAQADSVYLGGKISSCKVTEFDQAKKPSVHKIGGIPCDTESL